MKVKALRTFTTDISMKEGQVLDLAPDRAAYFISVGLAKEVKPEHKKADVKPTVKKQDVTAITRETKEDKASKDDK